MSTLLSFSEINDRLDDSQIDPTEFWDWLGEQREMDGDELENLIWVFENAPMYSYSILEDPEDPEECAPVVSLNSESDLDALESAIRHAESGRKFPVWVRVYRDKAGQETEEIGFERVDDPNAPDTDD